MGKQDKAAAAEAARLPDITFTGDIEYVTSAKACEEACARLLCLADAAGASQQREGAGGPGGEHADAGADELARALSGLDLHARERLVVGFDIEWRVTFQAGQGQRKTALVQLCVPTAAPKPKCLLLHVFHFGLTPSLVALIEREDVVKCGVRIQQDIAKVNRDYCAPSSSLPGTPHLQPVDGALARSLQPRGVADLGQMAVQRGVTGKTSLSALCERLLRRTLPKPQGTRVGNWEVMPLTNEQMAYAAADAYAGCLVYDVLVSPDALPLPPPPLPSSSPSPSPSPTPVAQGDQGGAAANAAPDDQRKHAPQPDVVAPGPQPAAHAQHDHGHAASRVSIGPAKLEAYRLFHEGLSVSDIAARRNIKPATVENYIADVAVGTGARLGKAGLERLGVSDEVREKVLRARDAVLRDDPNAVGRLKPVKDRVGDDISYGMVRFVLVDASQAAAVAQLGSGAADGAKEGC